MPTKEGSDYLRLYRSLQDHWMWKLKPFAAGQAWVDLLMRAQWHESTIPHPSKIGPTKLQPGELICSKRALAVSWGWTRKRVDRFINAATDDAMLDATNDATYTRIKILNWNKLQKFGLIIGATDGATKGATHDAIEGAKGGATMTPPPTPIQEGKEGEEGKERKEDHTSPTPPFSEAPPQRVGALQEQAESRDGGPGEEVERQLLQLAQRQKVIGRLDTLRSYLKGWIARSGAARVQAVLSGPDVVGRAILEIHKQHFDGTKRATRDEERKSRADPDCPKCRGSGKDKTTYVPGAGCFATCECTRRMA